MLKTLILGRQDVSNILNMHDTMSAVEEAYRAYNMNLVVQPPIVSIDVPENNGELDIKSCYSKTNESITVKTAVGFWDNPASYNLPTLLATIILYDAKNGFPLCIMDGSLITAFRTGAAGGLSAKLLARPDSKIIGMIGAGGQARMQVSAIKEVLPIETIKVWAQSQSELEHYKNDIESSMGIKVIICKTPDEAVENSDIVVTTTPSKQAIVKAESIKAGTHIIAIGADMEGKQELDPMLFKNAKIVVDSKAQCLQRGETRNPFVAGIISEKDIHAEIGELLLSTKYSREDNVEITIFDPTGMGIQDNTVARMVYDRAIELEKGQFLDLV